MVALNLVRAANSALPTTLPSNFTALFIGGTSGIGQSTLRQLVRHHPSPSVYIVGRSRASASPFLSELQRSSPQGKFRFLEADVSLIRNVDRVCEEVKARESHLNLLFMTPGGISLVGRRETGEGLDRLFALRYYARMRFVERLWGLLTKEEQEARVVSVLGGGFEGRVLEEDLDLKRRYSLINCALHSTTMTTLAMEHLGGKAGKEARLSFVHEFPGIVGTNIYSNSFPAPIAAVYNYGMWPLMWPFSVGLEESGERNLFAATAKRYPGKSSGENVDDIAVGSDGKKGSGVYLMNWKGETSVGNKTLQRYRAEGLPGRIWSHTTDLLDQAANKRNI